MKKIKFEKKANNAEIFNLPNVYANEITIEEK